MEQAHYLLNRLRATNDGIQTKTPGPDDLNPNAVNGIRLEALQTTLNAAAAMDSVKGAQNQIALGQFSQQTSQFNASTAQAQILQNRLFQNQLALAKLQGQQKQLQTIQVNNAAQTPPVNDPAVANRLADLAGQIEALTDQDTAITGQITALTTQAGTLPSAPTLSAATPPPPLTAPSQILAQTVQTLLGKTATAFDGPKLQASIALDNFLQMQYEIVAKQLTTLRDQTAADRRILFLEMPTSIQASDRRSLLLGGEDKLAQSWWRVSKIWRRYKTENSPCWSGNEFDDEALRYRSNPIAAALQTQLPLAKAQLDSLQTKSDKLQSEYKTLRDQILKLDIAKIRTTADTDELQTLINQASQRLQVERDQFDSARQQFLSAAARLNETNQDKDALAVKIPQFESSCRDERNNWDDDQQRLGKAISAVKLAEPKADKERAAALTQLAKQFGRIQQLRRDQFHELLDFYESQIYYAIGGPEGMLKAYPVSIRGLEGDRLGMDNGIVRAVELIPRQTALNVNTSHDLVRNSAMSFVWSTLFGFGLKVDYQRQKENYDQFIQQESFSSSFGKGQSTFGWTFGPLPGTRVLNSGDRNTYAVLEVPDDTSYLQMEGIGCAFHRTKFPLREYPPGPPAHDEDLKDYNCGVQLHSDVRVPDRTNSGGFWISAVDYAPADADHKTSVILRGGYFSPQTSILVNGVRISQVLGVGKPALNMDFGAADPAAANTAISGTFEYVNQEQVTLNLYIPAGFNDTDFPAITVITPARSMIINSLSLRINGKRSHLDEESILNPKPVPHLSLTSVQYLGTNAGKNVFHLRGQKLSDLAEVRLNGVACDQPAPLTDTDVQASCTSDMQFQWEFEALSSDSDPKKRIASSVTISNPRLIVLSSFQVLDGTQYGSDLHPSVINVQLTGSGFTPRTLLANAPDPVHITLAYLNPTTLLCTINNPQAIENVTVRDQDRDGLATILIPRPPDKKKDDSGQSTTTTVTQTEKKVVKK